MLQGPAAPELRSFKSLSRVKSIRRASHVPVGRRLSKTLSPHSPADTNTPTSLAVTTAQSGLPEEAETSPGSLGVTSGGGRSTTLKTVSLSLDTSPISPPAWSEEDPAGEAGKDLDAFYTGYVDKAFYCLRQDQAPRSWCLRLVENPYPSFQQDELNQRPFNFKK